MAKEESKKAPEKAPAEAAPAKKGLPIKMIAIIAVVMIVEAAVVVGIFSMLKPKDLHAKADPTHIVSDDGDVPKELPVIEDRFQNMRTGQNWIWDLSIAVQVKTRHSEKVAAVIKGRSGEIKEGIRQIIARADPAQLKEPELKSLNRQVSALLEKVIGVDEKSNEPLMERLLIPRARGFPADF
jgi:flagellar basal body-associated protein FliL